MSRHSAHHQPFSRASAACCCCLVVVVVIVVVSVCVCARARACVCVFRARACVFVPLVSLACRPRRCLMHAHFFVQVEPQPVIAHFPLVAADGSPVGYDARAGQWRVVIGDQNELKVVAALLLLLIFAMLWLSFHCFLRGLHDYLPCPRCSRTHARTHVGTIVRAF